MTARARRATRAYIAPRWLLAVRFVWKALGALAVVAVVGVAATAFVWRAFHQRQDERYVEREAAQEKEYDALLEQQQEDLLRLELEIADLERERDRLAKQVKQRER